MKKYLMLIASALLMAPQAFAAINLANVHCSFTDQSGLKLTISMVKKNNSIGETNLIQSGFQSARPIRKMSLLATAPKYRAQVKDRKGNSLRSQDVPVSMVRIFRQDPRDAVNSVIEATIPGEKILLANDPRSARSYVITNSSMIFTNGMATSLKGVCWKSRSQTK